ncbi:MAG TPA: ABC-type transport auxiliary lipoprotein family protein [Burkholderiales bacterium]|nr:ABC-type transport auxiliary lipoprotein family protein [Burkholderiales bacterium]
MTKLKKTSGTTSCRGGLSGRIRRIALLLAPVMLAAGCSSLLPAAQPQASYYSLDYAAQGRAPAPPAGGVVVVITQPRSTPGFDRPRMVYVKQAHQIEYFAQSQWVDSPAHMLAPLLVTALEHSGAFRAVMQAPGAAGQVRLDSEVLNLQQEFLRAPSQVRFTLRVRLVNEDTRAVIATREFEGLADAPSENPYGGVQAASQAVSKVLDEVAAFCADNSRGLAPMAVK